MGRSACWRLIGCGMHPWPSLILWAVALQVRTLGDLGLRPPQVAVPPMSTHLGVDQQVRVRRKGRLAAERVAGASEGLQRCNTLPRVSPNACMAVAGLPAALMALVKAPGAAAERRAPYLKFPHTVYHESLGNPLFLCSACGAQV